MATEFPRVRGISSCINLSTYVQGMSDYELLCEVVQVVNKLSELASLSVITYADPLQWDIASQYSQNTVVVDPQTGTAYLSIQPVPAGVQITNTDYWTPVADFSGIYTQLVDAITSVQYPDFGYAATENIDTGKLVWIGNRLYICTEPVSKGQNITEWAFTSTDLDAEFSKLVEQYADIIQSTTEDLNARISNIIANGQQTEGNTELIDIRTGYNGVVYPTAGDAVRSQVENLEQETLLNISKFIGVNAMPGEPYNNIDTFPVGSIVSGEFVHVAGKLFDYGQVITLGVSKNNIGNGAIQFALDINKNFYYRVYWGSWVDWTKVNVDMSQYVTKNDIVQKSNISMFENIGVVGDSYASGGMVIDGRIVVNYNISWPQVLKRASGTDFVNYTFAGATCKTWLTNSTYGLPKLKQDANKQMYCICLGINDADRQNTEPTGTIADIKDNYSDNPDTFFGNMGRIISEIQEKSPKSKILIFTIPKKQAQYVAYSGYIKQIADKFNLPCVDSMSDYFLSSSNFQDTMSGGHPLAVGYSGMANSMRKLIEKEMTSAYFNDYTGNGG